MLRATHGTDGGYYRHRRAQLRGDEWSTVPCRPCMDAHSEEERRRRGRGKVKVFKRPCSSCRLKTHVNERGVCARCQVAAPLEYQAGWVPRGGIQVPVVSLREVC